MTKFKIIAFSSTDEKHLSYIINEADEETACCIFEDCYSSIIDELEDSGYIVDIEIQKL